jgi:predicted RNase H-like HicB family nuclease
VPAVMHQAKPMKARGQSADSKPLTHIILRAIAFLDPDDGGYIAECIDLNLMVRRDTMEEAIRSLEEAIVGYLHTVCCDQSAASELVQYGRVQGLVPRPSPLFRRLRYHLHCLLAALKGNERNFQLREYSSSQFAHC